MIEKVFLISFIVFAVHYVLQPGEIFGSLGDWFHDHLPDRLKAPVYDCPVCMCFWYGSAAYWLIWATSWQEWIVVVIAALGLNAILNPIIHKDE